MSELESRMRAAFDAADYAAVATLIVTHYGGEIQAFLNARLRSASDGDDAFSMFVEDLWTGLPEFGWRCSARGWAYAIARNAANRLRASPLQQRKCNLSLSELAGLSSLIARGRSATQAHLRTEVKDRVRALREQLDPDDQMLLILRVDKGMSYRELALVLNDELEPGADAAARMRKRFERVRQRIRELARADGLLPDA